MAFPASLPTWILEPPQFYDNWPSATSKDQEATVDLCLPLLLSAETFHGQPPPLQRHKHIEFLRHFLRPLPKGFIPIDASRAWFPYWCLTGMALLGSDVSSYRQGLLETLRSMQNVAGGFGGGNGQASHLASTYGCLLAMATVGGDQIFDVVDRNALWRWLGNLKRTEGDFIMSEGGENDLRGTLIALVAISLLDLPVELPEDAPARSAGMTSFVDGLGEWIGKCQTYEGGLGCKPDCEAHASYTFCGLACLCILGPPAETLPRYLNMQLLVSWLSARQHAPEGGLNGRTNKLVDGCYSHWTGGCWALVQAALDTTSSRLNTLWEHQGLSRYILSCAQGPKGGLRDKPEKPPDAYHTCYNLVGLSWTQYRYHCRDTQDSTKKARLTAAFNWEITTSEDDLKMQTGNGQSWLQSVNGVLPLNPVYVIPLGAAEATRAYFESKAFY